jgi:hypothetical protein
MITMMSLVAAKFNHFQYGEVLTLYIMNKRRKGASTSRKCDGLDQENAFLPESL